MAERRHAPQHHHLQSSADTFACPLSQLAPPTGPTGPPSSPEAPPCKAKRRRKRHAPPGPAGVWFQSQLHNSAESTNIPGQPRKQQQEVAAADVSSCPAWMCMQHSLKLCTPFLPPYLSIRQRYDELRPRIPSEYLLLPELKMGSSLLLGDDKKLLVLVHAAVIQYHAHWTVELRDECGSTISAWMDPEFNEERDGGLLQIGVAWCLRDLRILVSETKQQWLLISRENIQRAWTPLEATKEFSDAQYIEWMTRRSHVRSSEDVQHGSLLVEEVREQEQRQTRVQEEEEEDDVVIPRGCATRVVTPHPSISNRRHNEPTASESNPCFLQEKDTEPSSVNSPLTRQEPNDPPRLGSVAASEPEEPINQPAVWANMFSQFRSPSSKMAPESDAASSRHRDPVRSTPPAEVIPCATKADSSQTEERRAPRNESSLSSHVAPLASPSSQHCPTGSRNAPKRVLPVTRVPPERGSSNRVSGFSQFSPVGATKGSDDVFSQFRSPMSAGVESHIVQAVSTTSNPHDRRRIEEGPRQISLDGSQLPIQTASSSAPGTKQNRSSPNKVAARPSSKANVESKSSAPSVSSNISSVLSQFAAVPAGKKMGGKKSPVAGGSIRNGTSSKVATKRRKLQSQKERSTSEQQQIRKKPQMSPKPDSPKLPSKLWLDADMSMMGMFDEDGHDHAYSQTLPTRPPRTTNLPQEKDAPSAEPSNPKTSSLFEASAFAGISVDDLFNEEDD